MSLCQLLVDLGLFNNKTQQTRGVCIDVKYYHYKLVTDVLLSTITKKYFL